MSEAVPAVRIDALAPRMIMALRVRRGALPRLREAAREHFALELPTNACRLALGDIRFVWSGLDAWNVHAEDSARDACAARLCSAFDGCATLVDISDARSIFSLQGALCGALLAKLADIDFHAQAFPPLRTCLTQIARIPVRISRLESPDRFEIEAPRSFAASLAEHVRIAAEEFQ